MPSLHASIVFERAFEGGGCGQVVVVNKGTQTCARYTLVVQIQPAWGGIAVCNSQPLTSHLMLQHSNATTGESRQRVALGTIHLASWSRLQQLILDSHPACQQVFTFCNHGSIHQIVVVPVSVVHGVAILSESWECRYLHLLVQRRRRQSTCQQGEQARTSVCAQPQWRQIPA